MENRVSRVENRLDKYGDDISAVRQDLATLKKRVSHLPAKEYLWKVAAAIMAALVTFVDKLQAMIGTGQ